MAERWDLRENNGVAVHRTLNSRKKYIPKLKTQEDICTQ